MLPLNTITVGAAVTPAVTKTWFSHYLNRKPLRQKPTAHISYDLGLHLVRRFVEYSALHTIEELQAFTSQWVPAPRWVKVEDVEIPQADVTKAAEFLQDQLGPDGIEQVGGKEWWQWRRDNQPLKAEWIEMRKDYNERKEKGENGRRVILYVHGGAYYFGSVDEHRYQIQRHARKLKAKCLAPRYRLAPQFPFPCGLHDCLSAYLYLLNKHDPTEIIVAGDSAGGGMVLSLLVILRDQGVPLPAGGILLSPWVDLMHSFPSLSGGNELDYIPSDGFIHKPSMGWPPPTLEDVKDNIMPTGVAAGVPKVQDTPGISDDDMRKKDLEVPDRDKKQGYSVVDPDNIVENTSSPLQRSLSKASKPSKSAPKGPNAVRDNITGRVETSPHLPSVMVDGKLVQIRDQIQIYAPNHLLTHPLVSPVLQTSLGGLPPLLIQVGGGEMLRDEQLYLAHKAADPARYPPRKELLDKYDPERVALSKYKPTDVQVQLWEDLCHVGHTLSWTRPAKFMYRSVAQFGAWALARAQGRAIDIPYDDDSDSDSVSSGDETQDAKVKEPPAGANGTVPTINTPKSGSVGKAGDPLPPFINHMIRQRVDRHGDIWELDSVEELACMKMDPDQIGVLHEAPVKKWLSRQEKWNKKFAATKRELQKKRSRQLEHGYEGLPEGEKPPPTALAGRRAKDLPKIRKITKGYGMMMWSGWGSKHDEMRMQGDETADTAEKAGAQKELTGIDTSHRDHRANQLQTPKDKRPRSRSRSRSVVDEGQTSDDPRATALNSSRTSASENEKPQLEVPTGATVVGSTLIPTSSTATTRPTDMQGVAYPFKLKVPDEDVKSTNTSMLTLDSAEVVSMRSKMGTNAGVETPSSGDARAGEGASGVGARPTVERFETAAERL